MEIEKRKPLTKRQWAFLFHKQEGLCGCGCGQKMNALSDKITDEHVKPLSMGGTNDLSNRELWLTECTKPKTAGEATVRAKAERQSGRKGQYARRKKNGSKLQSRGFDKSLRKKMNGKVERK